MKNTIEIYNPATGWFRYIRELLNVERLYEKYEEKFIASLIDLGMREDEHGLAPRFIPGTRKVNPRSLNDDVVMFALSKEPGTIQKLSRIAYFKVRSQLQELKDPVVKQQHTTVELFLYPISTAGVLQGFGVPRELAQQWLETNKECSKTAAMQQILMELDADASDANILKAMNFFQETIKKLKQIAKTLNPALS